MFLRHQKSHVSPLNFRLNGFDFTDRAASNHFAGRSVAGGVPAVLLRHRPHRGRPRRTGLGRGALQLHRIRGGSLLREDVRLPTLLLVLSHHERQYVRIGVFFKDNSKPLVIKQISRAVRGVNSIA